MSIPSALQTLYRALKLVGDQGLPSDTRGFPQRNAPSPLPVFFRFIASRLRAAAPEQKTARDATSAVTQLVQNLGARHQSVWLRAGEQTWLDTGIDLQVDEELTLLARGALVLSAALKMQVGPGGAVWYRIGDAGVRALPAAGGVIRAPAAGRLHLLAAIPGSFATPRGDLLAESQAMPLSGGIQVDLVRWPGPTSEGLQAAAEKSQLFAALRDGYQQNHAPPPGWHYLWRVGEARVFKPCAESDAICCDTQGDVAILQHPVDLPLTETLRLEWSWLMESLPSALAEHIQPTHDYLSIAVEFDNGLDLTYMWSARLPVDTIFQCPLPWWDQRETHWVLRNPDSAFAEWHAENRALQEDYTRAIGGELPQRVVGIWLIANSAFQAGSGRCRYRQIRLRDGSVEQCLPSR